MKKFIESAAYVLIASFIAAVAALCAIKYAGGKFLPKSFDSSAVTAQVDMQSYSKQLKSLTDVFQLRQEMMDESRIDSTFLAIDDGPLSNVVSVLLKRDGYTSKDQIVNEYITGRAVYDNLPPSPTVQSNVTTTQESSDIANLSLVKEGSTTVTEGPPTDVGGGSQPTKDTVINGKRYKPVN